MPGANWPPDYAETSGEGQREPALVRRAATQLGPLLGEVVFVGGSVTDLLLSDRAAPEVRPTRDVDVIIEVASWGAYERVASRLRQAGFREDQSEGAPICRWMTSDGIILDAMPTEEGILGFSNPWYRPAIRTAEEREISPGLNIRLIDAPHFIATKLVAFETRGRGDYWVSHDFEDVLAVVDGRPELLDELAASNAALRAFVGGRFARLGADPGFPEAVAGFLSTDSASQRRLPVLMARLAAMARLDEQS